MQLVIASTPLSVRQGLTQIISAPALAASSAGLRERVELVLAEVLNNVVEHAYATQTGDITVQVQLRPGGIDCLVCDCGRAMPLLRLPAGRPGIRDTSDPPEGGFGWHLIRQLTCGLNYTRIGERNELRFHVPDREGED